mmetsp:Transcript_15008/g.52690  ORF Transcript_15008/g.52690 Transcript_15008/m.52690 type:complete len:300 (+) Transcript_15008:64-963(+)
MAPGMCPPPLAECESEDEGIFANTPRPCRNPFSVEENASDSDGDAGSDGGAAACAPPSADNRRRGSSDSDVGARLGRQFHAGEAEQAPIRRSCLGPLLWDDQRAPQTSGTVMSGQQAAGRELLVKRTPVAAQSTSSVCQTGYTRPAFGAGKYASAPPFPGGPLATGSHKHFPRRSCSISGPSRQEPIQPLGVPSARARSKPANRGRIVTLGDGSPFEVKPPQQQPSTTHFKSGAATTRKMIEAAGLVPCKPLQPPCRTVDPSGSTSPVPNANDGRVEHVARQDAKSLNLNQLLADFAII